MTTLGGPLCGLSWGFLSRVMSFLCYHKAFLHKDRWNSAHGLFDWPFCCSEQGNRTCGAIQRNTICILHIFKFRQLTKVIQAVRVGSVLILLLYKLEVMRSLISDHARIFPATVNNVTEALPRVLLHKELRWDILHFHHFRAVRKAVHSRHANCHTAEG